MAENHPRLRRKALKLMRKAWAAYEVTGPARRIDVVQFIRAANRAESALLRVVSGAMDDPGPRCAYGEIMHLRSSVLTRAGGRLAA